MAIFISFCLTSFILLKYSLQNRSFNYLFTTIVLKNKVVWNKKQVENWGQLGKLRRNDLIQYLFKLFFLTIQYLFKLKPILCFYLCEGRNYPTHRSWLIWVNFFSLKELIWMKLKTPCVWWPGNFIAPKFLKYFRLFFLRK